MIHIENNKIPEELRESAIYLYGGGYTGKVVIELFKENGVGIACVIDDDEGLQGKEVMGIPVISFQRFREIYQADGNLSVVLTSIYGKIILKKLEQLPGLKIYELFEWYSELMDNREGSIQKFEVNDLEMLKREWRALETRWADSRSIKVLKGLLKYFETKDLNDIAAICSEEEHYFVQEVLDSVKQPLFMIDAGAYRGELLNSIIHNDIHFEKLYCFEPDKKNYSLLCDQAMKNNQAGEQICINKGLWRESGRLYFKGGDDAVSRIVTYETDEFVDVISIDEFIGENRCNFIKMDIEGAELPALKGAMNVIRRERPILAISIYHSLRDYWEIPKFLMDTLEDYRYYVRQHALIYGETVLYAIPK